MKDKLLYIILFFVVSIFSSLVILYEKQTKINQHLEVKTKQYKRNYNASYHEYKELANIIFNIKINRPEIINIFKYAAKGTKEEQSKVRTDLYNTLKHTYDYLMVYKNKQLHFHTSDNKSFLRFHRPDIYGDDLTNIRETIKYVNETKKPIDGFEEGRIYNGYRFVFPIFNDKEHLGSVEISFNTLAISSQFDKHYNLLTNFLILKSVVDSKVFEDEKGNYSDSPLKKYYIENLLLKDDGKSESLKLIEQFSKKTLNIVNKKSNDIESFSLYDSNIEKIVTFIKVQNPITKKVIGVFIVTSDAYYIFNKTQNSYFLLILANLFILSTLYLVYKEKRYRAKLRSHNETLAEKIKEKTKEQSLLLSLFDKGDTVLFKWNNDDVWSVDYVSLSVEKFTGYKKSDFTSNKVNYASIVHKNDIKRVSDEVSFAINSDLEFFKHEPYRIVLKDKTIKWVLDYTIIVRDENNKISHFIGIIGDITEIKNQEKIILEQSRLAQMGEMISMIAHQWRQPLGAISATAIDMKMQSEFEKFNLDEKEDVKKYESYINNGLDSIDVFVKDLTYTIDDFRNFFQPDKTYDLDTIVKPLNKALRIINASLKHYGIEIIKECSICNKETNIYNGIDMIQKCSTCDKKINIYSGEMMQVILNILKNSQDNFKEKKVDNPKIMISCSCGMSDNKVVLKISDNGGGIPEDILPKIFEPYFSTKDEKNGTGLGLYMSKIIVEEHHKGKFLVENIDGGVCFTIELNDIKELD